MNAAHTPTPRTDALLVSILESCGEIHGGNAPANWVQHARQLERELADARDQIDDLTATGIHSCGSECKRPNCVLRRELAEVTKQRDALARIGGKLRNVCPSSCDDYVAEWDKAIATLKGMTE